ncbi:MAG: excalibur calcium-binding domain-containing protein [Microthrixaceae bacterium]
MKRLGLATILLVAASFGLTSCEYKNCTELNKTYPHGVGLPGAVDKTSGTPVTSFRRDANLYQLNARLDRDKDKIACEKR